MRHNIVVGDCRFRGHSTLPLDARPNRLVPYFLCRMSSLEAEMADDRTVQLLADRVLHLLKVLEATPDDEPLRGVDVAIAAIEEAARGADLRAPVSITGRGMAQRLQLRSPFNQAVEDAGYGPGWKRLLGEKTYLAHALQMREKLLYYLTLWRGWLAQPASARGTDCAS